MTGHISLDDYRAVRRSIASAEVQVAASHGLKRPIDVDRLIEGWERFASDVQEGFAGGVYEYIRELVMRDYLDEVVGLVDDGARLFLSVLLEAPDLRLQAGTMANRPGWDLSDRYKSPGSGWWWHRGPLLLARMSKQFPDAPPDVAGN